MSQQIKKDKSFNVYINQGEMYQIQEWVSKHQKIETGGDLFGLWLDDHTAVVQFVLGPGKKCRRTETSFFQDVEYLQQAGSYLTGKHGLCDIGQWHSHHRLSLSKPSHGDENTVWGNMPVLGLNRYIVFIANITNKVTVNCFLFHYQGRKRSLTKGQFKYLDGNSPMRLNEMVLQNTFDGLDSFIQPAIFESEMNFLRNNDDNIETSTGDKEQNAEHEKCTTPKTTELKNRCDESEQPHERATFEREMKFLRSNDDITETSTGDEQKVEHGYNTSFEPEQQNRNFLRGNNDAKDSNNNLKDKNAKTYTENREQHGKNRLRPDNDKDDVSHENNNTYTRNTEQHDTSVSSRQGKPSRNSLQRNKDRKDKRDISNEENFETYKENGEWYDRSNRIQDGRHNINSSRGYKRAKANNDLLKHDKVKTFIGNTERNSAKNSVENGHDNRNSFQREDEAKHNPDDLNKEYIEKFRGNNAKNSVTPGKDNENSLDNVSKKLVVTVVHMPEVQRVTRHGMRSGQNALQQQPSTPKKEQRASLNNKRQTTFGNVTSIPIQRTPQKQKINGGDSELVNDPSIKGGSTQHSDIKHNTKHYRSPNPEFKKVPQNEHQFKIEEIPHTRSGTKQPKESHSEGVKNRKKEDKTKGKKTTGCLNCFGKKTRQVSDTAEDKRPIKVFMYETAL